MRDVAWLCLAAGLSVAGCAPRHEGKLITTIEGRAHTVHIFTGHRYTVEDASGRTLAADLSEEAFRARFPAVYQATEEAIADRHARRESPAPLGAGPGSPRP